MSDLPERFRHGALRFEEARARRASLLIELLVVLLIIGILPSDRYPAFRR